MRAGSGSVSSSTAGCLLLPAIRPSSDALFGLAWKKHKPPSVGAKRQSLPVLARDLQRESGFLEVFFNPEFLHLRKDGVGAGYTCLVSLYDFIHFFFLLPKPLLLALWITLRRHKQLAGPKLQDRHDNVYLSSMIEQPSKSFFRRRQQRTEFWPRQQVQK